jgi:8-oxo-dGTP diphosphatase
VRRLANTFRGSSAVEQLAVNEKVVGPIPTPGARLVRFCATGPCRNTERTQMKDQFLIGVFAIIFDPQGRVLLCHRRDHDLWNLPGGGLSHGESPWDGVKREVKEETGMDVSVERLAGVYDKPDKNEIVFSFVCKIVDGEITLNDEADRIEYFKVSEFPQNTSPKQVARIQDAIDSPGSLVMKTHTGKSSIQLLQEGKL